MKYILLQIFYQKYAHYESSLTWIEIFIRASRVIPDNVKRWLFDNKVGDQGQRRVGRQLTQIGT